MTHLHHWLCLGLAISAASPTLPTQVYAQDNGSAEAQLKKIVDSYVGKPLDAEQKQLLFLAKGVVEAGRLRFKDDKEAVEELDVLQELLDDIKDVKTLNELDVRALLLISGLTNKYGTRLSLKERPVRTIQGIAVCAQHKHPREGAEMISVIFKEDAGFLGGQKLPLHSAERDGTKGAFLGDLVVLSANVKDTNSASVAGFYHGPYIGVEDVVIDTNDVASLFDHEIKSAASKRAVGHVQFHNPSTIALKFFIDSWYDDEGKLHRVDGKAGWNVAAEGVISPVLPDAGTNKRIYASAINYRIKTKDGVHVISHTAYPQRLVRRGKLTGDLVVRATVDKETLHEAYRNDPGMAKFNAFLAVGSEVLARYADKKKGWLAAATSVSARNLRDRSIRETLKADFFDLDDESIENIQVVISLSLDKRLNLSAAREEASKRAILDALRDKDPDLAKAGQVADFIYDVYVAKSQQGS